MEGQRQFIFTDPNQEQLFYGDNLQYEVQNGYGDVAGENKDTPRTPFDDLVDEVGEQ